LYDMHGNALEWCDDGVKGEDGVIRRAMRGGSYYDGTFNCRTVLRNPHRPTDREPTFGLRVSRVRVVTEAVSLPPRIALTPPPPSVALTALCRDQIPPAALAYAGDGNPQKAPATLVAVLGEPEPIHTSRAVCLASSPNGRWLASGSEDRTVLLRDAATGKVVRVLLGHKALLTLVAFTPDSKTLLSADVDGTVKLWSTAAEGEPTNVHFKIKKLPVRRLKPSYRGIFRPNLIRTYFADKVRTAEEPSEVSQRTSSAHETPSRHSGWMARR
ncbi:MAG: hypothetical protein ACK4RK_20705, partial [Gemmataceae bacterium]